MRYFTLAIILIAISFKTANAQSLMGRPQPAAPPAHAPIGVPLRANHKAVSQQQQTSVAVVTEVEQPVITAIYRGPGTFDQQLFDTAVAAAAAYEAGSSGVQSTVVTSTPEATLVQPMATTTKFAPDAQEVKARALGKKQVEDLHDGDHYGVDEQLDKGTWQHGETHAGMPSSLSSRPIDDASRVGR